MFKHILILIYEEVMFILFNVLSACSNVTFEYHGYKLQTWRFFYFIFIFITAHVHSQGQAKLHDQQAQQFEMEVINYPPLLCFAPDSFMYHVQYTIL